MSPIDPSPARRSRALSAFVARHRSRGGGVLLDAVTGVPGAEAMRMRAGAELARARRHGTALTILHVALEGTADVDDAAGTRAADELRRRAALGMAAALRGEDLVARIGQDAFAIVLPGVEASDLAPVAGRLSAVAARVRADGVAHEPLSVTIGAAAYPADAEDVETLLGLAAERAGEPGPLIVPAAPPPVPDGDGAWRLGAAGLGMLAVATLLALAWFGLPALVDAQAARRGVLLVTFVALVAGGLWAGQHTRGHERLGWRLMAASGFVAALPVVAPGTLIVFALALLLIAADGWLRDRDRLLDGAVCAALMAGVIVAFALPPAAAWASDSLGEHVSLALRAVGITVAGMSLMLVGSSVSPRKRPDVWLLALGFVVPLVLSIGVLHHGGAWDQGAAWKALYLISAITSLGAMWLRRRHAGPVDRELRDRQAVRLVGLAGIGGFVGLMIAAVAVHGAIAWPVVVVLAILGVLRYVRAAAISSENRHLAVRALRAERERAAQNHAGLRALTAALEARDGYTGRHTEETTALTSRVAVALGLDAEQRREVDTVALLHDIGKIGTPNEILHKDGPLTDEEWVVMREHPVVGERILNAVPGLGPIARAVRHEHERWDGGGYPDGLAGETIPLASRIVLVCDAYHAMTSDRPYRRAMPVADAIAELRRCAGTQFDPAVVWALIEVLENERRPAAERRAALV
jgi:diguanylate cyclase (GGDEF)-like protein